MPPDLYTEILGLPPEPRPLSYYELLGLPLFEADRAVIHAAVLRQTAELKRWALDPRQGRIERVQEMLNEVGRAGFVLEDPKTRADYERQLADRLGIPLPQRDAKAPLFAQVCRHCRTMMPAGAPVCPACGGAAARPGAEVTAESHSGVGLRPAAPPPPPSPPAEREPGSEVRPQPPLPPTPSPLVERGHGGEDRSRLPLPPTPSPRAERGRGAAARRAARRRAEGTPENDSAEGLRPVRSPTRIVGLAIGIPLAAAALFWVGFLVGRAASPVPEGAAKELAQARAAQSAAEAQATIEGKARAAAEREARRLAQALKENELKGKRAAASPSAPTPQTPAVPVVEAKQGPFEVYTGWPFDAAEAKRRQKETARALGVPVEQSVDLPGAVKMAFVLIPTGEFLMGDERGGADEKPVHRVTLTKPFSLGKHEVTEDQWQAVMGRDPSDFKGAKNPVECVSWDDCQAFVSKLSEKFPGKKFRLPTEAEWEYACRAGSASRFSFGDADADLAQYAWYGDNSNQRTHPVGQKRPNPWGLCDMHGNVAEWCWDWFGPYPAAEQRDPSGPPGGQDRVLRGGGWCSEPTYCRSALRNGNAPVNHVQGGGLRVVFVPGP